MCPFLTGSDIVTANFINFGIMIFLLIWIVFVPVVITARLDKIVKVLEEIKKQ